MSLNSAPPQDTVESNILDNTEVVEGEGSQMDQEPKGVCTECILTKELTILPIKTSNRVKANAWRSSVIQGKYQSRFLL